MSSSPTILLSLWTVKTIASLIIASRKRFVIARVSSTKLSDIRFTPAFLANRLKTGRVIRIDLSLIVCVERTRAALCL